MNGIERHRITFDLGVVEFGSDWCVSRLQRKQAGMKLSDLIYSNLHLKYCEYFQCITSYKQQSLFLSGLLDIQSKAKHQDNKNQRKIFVTRFVSIEYISVKQKVTIKRFTQSQILTLFSGRRTKNILQKIVFVINYIDRNAAVKQCVCRLDKYFL